MTAESATERLQAALEAAAHRGDSWPCRDDDAWTSEDYAERVEAARRCLGCCVMSLCAAAAVEGRETFGVWASVDYGDKAQRRAAMRAGAA